MPFFSVLSSFYVACSFYVCNSVTMSKKMKNNVCCCMEALNIFFLILKKKMVLRDYGTWLNCVVQYSTHFYSEA